MVDYSKIPVGVHSLHFSKSEAEEELWRIQIQALKQNAHLLTALEDSMVRQNLIEYFEWRMPDFGDYDYNHYSEEYHITKLNLEDEDISQEHFINIIKITNFFSYELTEVAEEVTFFAPFSDFEFKNSWGETQKLDFSYPIPEILGTQVYLSAMEADFELKQLIGQQYDELGGQDPKDLYQLKKMNYEEYLQFRFEELIPGGINDIGNQTHEFSNEDDLIDFYRVNYQLPSDFLKKKRTALFKG